MRVRLRGRLREQEGARGLVRVRLRGRLRLEQEGAPGEG